MTNEILIDPDALNSRLGEPDVKLLDVRSGEDFAMGHLPGARHFSVYGINTYDSDDAPLASFARMWAFQLELRGLTADDFVVVYDDQTGMSAARAFWFLEYLGHQKVAVLNGGLTAWRNADLPIERDAKAATPSPYQYTTQRNVVATWYDVRDAISNTDSVIIDTRREAEYVGAECNTVRCGTIPGAIHLEWTNHLTPDGKMKPNQALGTLFESHGITRGKKVIAFCNTGYRSAHAYLALRLLNYPHVRNYVGSWQEWGNRDGCPVINPVG
ncbi:MAG: sulfurtransferase [Gammaproteobacteria bacterium]|nr:sulfurtransferase [Gammaproteobacteria bacterium]